MTDKKRQSKIEKAFPAIGRGLLESERPAVEAFKRKYAKPPEPVAYLHQVVCGDGEPDQALSFAPDNFPLAGTLGYKSLSYQPLYTRPQQWISVDERVPSGRNCLAVYENRGGSQFVIRAMYVEQFQIEAQGDDCDTEINDENDTEYLREGWYELIDNWGEYTSVRVCEGVVTHWMPLPAAPGVQALIGTSTSSKDNMVRAADAAETRDAQGGA